MESMLHKNMNNKTKYSSQTIQPITFPDRLNFFIITISIHYYENIFGEKFVRVFVPNKYYYQTDSVKNSSNLMWKCKGFVFNYIQEQ
jgi:hypothetical protein